MTKGTNDVQESTSDGLLKGLTLTPVITSILKPSADLIGQELRDLIKEKIDLIKNRKKAENLTEHLRTVGEKLQKKKKEPNPNLTTIKQLSLFDKWVEGAENVDPTDKILAEMWQELLVQISEGNNPNEILIEKMKMLQADDAKLLLRLGEERRVLMLPSIKRFFSFLPKTKEHADEETYRLKRLKDIDILDSYLSFNFPVNIILLLLVITCGWYIWSYFSHRNFEWEFSWQLAVGGYFLLGFLVVLSSFLIPKRKYVLTWVGRSLLSYVKIEKETQDSTKENEKV